MAVLACLENVDGFQPAPPTNQNSRSTWTLKSRRHHISPLTTSMPKATRIVVSFARKPFARLRGQRDNSDAKIREWKRKYSSIRTFRRVHGRNKRVDRGDWSASKARCFYNFKVGRASKALLALGLSDHLIGDLNSKSRDKIKKYTNERSVVLVRVPVKLAEGIRTMKKTGRFDPDGLSLEYRKEEATRQVLDHLKKEGIDDPPKGLVDSKVSLLLFEKASRPNSDVNWLAFFNPRTDLPGLVEFSWSNALHVANMGSQQAYEDFLAPFLLQGKGSFVPDTCKRFIRSVFPECYVNLRGSLIKRYTAS